MTHVAGDPQMVTVRVDPWMTDYGASAEADFDPALVLPTDTTVETVDWSTPIRPAVVEPEAKVFFTDGVVFFTDGVLRTEVRLLVEAVPVPRGAWRGLMRWGPCGSMDGPRSTRAS